MAGIHEMKTGTEQESATLEEIERLWAETFGEKYGWMVTLGFLNVGEQLSNGNSKCVPGVTFSPSFLEMVTLEVQAQIYEQFADIFRQFAERARAGIHPNEVTVTQ